MGMVRIHWITEQELEQYIKIFQCLVDTFSLALETRALEATAFFLSSLRAARRAFPTNFFFSFWNNSTQDQKEWASTQALSLKYQALVQDTQRLNTSSKYSMATKIHNIRIYFLKLCVYGRLWIAISQGQDILT